MNWKGSLLIGAVLALAGCASPPVQYYDLATPAAASAATQDVHSAFAVRLRVSEVPAAVDRIQLVVHDPATSPGVQVLNDSLWVAPLRDQLQSQLTAGVSARLGVPDVARLSTSHALPVRNFTVRVTRFDLVWGRAAWLDASWTDQAPSSHTAKICQARLSLAAGTSVSSLVLAQQRLVADLARLIANANNQEGPLVHAGVVSSGCTL